MKWIQGHISVAINLALKCRWRNDPWACSLLGDIAKKRGDFLNALRFYSEALQKGDEEAGRQIEAMKKETKSHCSSMTRGVVLLTFSRSPATFRDALLNAPTLMPWKQSLLEHHFPVELATGAKVFVKVDDYKPLMEFIRLHSVRFGAKHVFVDFSLQDIVVSIVRTECPSRSNVYPRSRNEMPLNFAAAASRLAPGEVSVVNTFFDIHVPNQSSLRSSTQEDGECTASTTEANSRCKGKKARRARPSPVCEGSSQQGHQNPDSEGESNTL